MSLSFEMYHGAVIDLVGQLPGQDLSERLQRREAAYQNLHPDSPPGVYEHATALVEPLIEAAYLAELSPERGAALAFAAAHHDDGKGECLWVFAHPKAIDRSDPYFNKVISSHPEDGFRPLRRRYMLNDDSRVASILRLASVEVLTHHTNALDPANSYPSESVLRDFYVFVQDIRRDDLGVALEDGRLLTAIDCLHAILSRRAYTKERSLRDGKTRKDRESDLDYAVRIASSTVQPNTYGLSLETLGSLVMAHMPELEADRPEA